MVAVAVGEVWWKWGVELISIIFFSLILIAFSFFLQVDL